MHGILHAECKARALEDITTFEQGYALQTTVPLRSL